MCHYHSHKADNMSIGVCFSYSGTPMAFICF